MGGGGGTQTTTQNTGPWIGEQAPLMSIYTQAGNLENTAVPQYYPGTTYAPLTDQQKADIQGIQGIGGQGGTQGLQTAGQANNLLAGGVDVGAVEPINAMGQGVLANELDPNYLNPWNSPSFGTVVNNTLAAAIPATENTFTAGNRMNSGLANRATTMAATDAVGELAQKQYQANQAIQANAQAQAQQQMEAAQGRQLQAIGMAPQIDTQTLGDYAAALSATGMSQQDVQNQINADIQRYNYGQMLPWNQLQLYENAVTGTGSPGSTMVGQQPTTSNTFANVMGGLTTAGTLGMATAALITA